MSEIIVKPLEWENLGGGVYKAPSPLFGSIRIEPYGNEYGVTWSVPGMCNTFTKGFFGTPDEAKAAAQSDYEARIRSALSVPLPEIEGGDGWQPIETAPKDETDILLADCRVHGGFMTVASYEIVDGSEWVWHTNDGPSYHTEAFTHWRPLPAAPCASIEGETP